MHPAPSLIVFTVLSGLGLGMMTWVGLGLGGSEPAAAWALGLVALAATGAGGLASTAHLARPSRAWRAFSQWRSSWLSREACLMIGTVGAYLVYIAVWLATGTRNVVLGIVVVVLAFATVYATAMIYGQLRTVPRWSTTPTRWLFLAVSLSSGLLGVAAVSVFVRGSVPGVLVLAALVIAGGVAFWWQTKAVETAHTSTLNTATGLGRDGARVRLMEPPHTEPNYLMTEMAYRVGRQRAAALKRLGLVLGFAAPIVLVLGSWIVGPWALVLGLLSHLVGLAALRWLFFAEAEHVQALYYGR